MARRDLPAAPPGMKNFSYTAVSQSGRRVKAKMQAPDADVVVEALAAEGWVPVKISEISSGGLNIDLADLIGRGGLRLKPADLATFARQLHQLLRAGVSVPKTLAALGDEADPRMAEMCMGVADQVTAGVPLAEAFAQYPTAFDDVFCAYIAAGEASGTLVQATGRLAKLLERESAMRNKVKAATAYPKMASFAIGAVILAVLMFMVPAFANLYSNFGTELPGPTRALLTVSGAVNPIHPQIGAVERIDVPVEGSDEPVTFNVIDDTIDVTADEVAGAWDPLEAPLPNGASGRRTLSEEDDGRLSVHAGSQLVAKTDYAGERGPQRSGVTVLALCDTGDGDRTVEVITPPPGQNRAWTECPAGSEATYSVGLIGRVTELVTNPGAEWLNPTTWLEPLRQPNRSWLSSPINFTSPVLWALAAGFFARRWLRARRDDLDVGERVDRARFAVPIFGGLNRRIALFRWSSTLAGCLESGVPTHDALDLAARASGSRWIRKATLTLQEGVASGEPIHAGLAKHKDLFDPNLRALVSTGEATGELDQLLDSTATTLDEDITALISGLAAKIETILIITMGVVVGSIVIVLYLPIFGLAGAAGEGIGVTHYLPPSELPPFEGPAG